MSVRKLKDSLTNLESAVSNLERAITIPRDRELVYEGTIHRFEVTIELMWKTLKRALEYEGLQPKTPRETLKEAFRIGWIDQETIWIDMLESRNTTSHQYLAEELLEENYEDVVKVTPILRATLDFLKNRYAGLEPTT
ncbi:HI0074 family nucleotidyltransferase substrate-binding subunit [Bradyrhizobium sp. 2S1]|uniref:HI0074 family nucleotidyltransferase substrate-binding subunit n=1 Tax=Bradyrhizobium sp. 2S1 TaxID=1404429 RepID=UPI00140D387B|nr:HI0074 family nucleotidyltransferase substrate-binding subunit [Bradyrhizobium sp. 2S1]MCK7664543.1 nucleotidyltransferase substrate binding protein [Bradyrhizobium sp. 2S1]